MPTRPDPYIPQKGGFQLAKWVLLVSFFLCVFEGAIRKWILGGSIGTASQAAYVSKDLAFAALLLFSRKYSPPYALRWFRKYFYFGTAWISVGALLSGVHGVSPIGAVLTLRSLIILPLIALLIVPRLPTSACKVVVWAAALAAIGNCGLSVIQSRLPPDHFLNQYAISDVPVIALETGVRAAGTFAYITGLGVMSTVAVWAGLGIMSSATSLRAKMLGWITIVAGVGCALTSVSRAPLVINTLMLSGWAAFARLGRQRIMAVLLTAAVVVVLGAVLGFLPIAQRLSDAFLERTETSDDVFTERAFGQTSKMLSAANFAPLGNGLGFEQVGGNYFSTGQMSFANFEGQFPRIVMDTSILGLIGYGIICLSALYALQLAKRQASPSNRALLLATQILLASIFYGSEVYNHTASSFCWIIFAAAMASVNKPVQPGLVARV